MRGIAGLASAPEVRTLDSSNVPGNWSPVFGYQVNETTSFTLSAVWACETLIADAIATLPVDTYRKTADPLSSLREPTKAPAWLENPNPENNRIDYDTQRILSLLGYGNSYAYLVRQGGSSDPMAPVLERWLLNPEHVEVIRLQGDVEQSPLRYFVRGQPVELGNMQHIRGYVRPGQVKGMSVITNARIGLGMSTAAEQAGAMLYENGMMVGGALEVPQMPVDVQASVLDRLEAKLIERNGGGSRNAGRPLILAGGTQWKPTMMTMSDAQYLETRKFQINEVCRWFRVPGHKIQDIIAHASQGGGMGIEQQAGEFAQDTLLTWTRRLEIADSALLPRGQYLKYNLDAYVRADMATRYEAYSKARMGGWMNADQISALEDLPPLPDGKGQIFLQPANYIEAGTTIAAVPEPPVPEPPAPTQNNITLSPVIHTPDVRVTSPDIHIDPTFHIAEHAAPEPAEIRFEPVIQVEAAPAPIVHVAPAEVRVEAPIVNVEAPKAPIVNVKLPEKRKTIRKVIRDTNGEITRIEEE